MGNGLANGCDMGGIVVRVGQSGQAHAATQQTPSNADDERRRCGCWSINGASKGRRKGAGATGNVGRRTTSIPRLDSRSAPARAIASAMTMSVPSGKCGPCASRAPREEGHRAIGR